MELMNKFCKKTFPGFPTWEIQLLLKVECIEGVVEFWKIIKNLERRKRNCPNIPFLNSVLVTWHTSQFYSAALIKWKSTSEIINMECFKLLKLKNWYQINSKVDFPNGRNTWYKWFWKVKFWILKSVDFIFLELSVASISTTKICM